MTAPDDARHLILPTGTANQPAELGRLNTLLEAAGLGQPLGEPAGPGTGELTRVPLASGADPVAVQEALLRLNRDGTQGVPVAMRDVDYTAATVEDGAHKQFLAAGKRTGFATIAWRAVDEEQMWAAPAWSGTGTRPVVALLDTEIRYHGWLMDASGAPCWEPAPDWSAPLPIPQLAFTEDGPDLGSHYGHATFIAGRLRLIAPAVKILSFEVMGRDGKANEANLYSALKWLVDRPGTASVVLMAMGRQQDAADDRSADFQNVKSAIETLAGQGVQVVASAGNGHSDKPVVPAALATQLEQVHSVGAGTSPDDRATFSNYGDWVTKWRPGTGLISLMPAQPTDSPYSDGYAEWSGTSFSAADYAGYLAARLTAKG
jgi:hypothetical protein